MKKLATALLTATVTVGALSACQTTTVAPAPQGDAVLQTLNSASLQAYNWQLVDATRNDGTKIAPLFYNPAKPLTLSFFTDGNDNRVSFLNTCNNLGASYAVQGGTVVLNNVLAIMRACPDAEAKFDTAAMATVQGKYSISKRANQAPVLTIKNANQVAHFQAVAK